MTKEDDVSGASQVETQPNPFALRELLALARDIAFVTAIYAYFAGFIFFYDWKGEFGLPVSIIDESPFHIFVYAFQVLYESWYEIVGYVAFSIAAWVAVTMAFRKNARLKNFHQTRKACAIFVVTCVVLGFFPVLNKLASDDADNYVDGIRAGIIGIGIIGTEPNIKLLLKPEVKHFFDQNFVYDNEHFCLTLVAETTDTIYALRQDMKNHEECEERTPPIGSKLPYGYVYAIPKEIVISTIIQQWRTVVPKL